MNRNYFLLLIVSAFTLFSGCKKDPDSGPGSVEIEFTNAVGNIGLQFNKNYVNELGQVFTVSKFKYYISNIELKSDDGSVYKHNGYFLVDQEKPESKVFTISNVPQGTYTEVSFLIGIDSARNTSGAQEGALDAINGMFWDWNSGYIFLKMEGNSPSAPGSGTNLVYHIGGFQDPVNCIRRVTPSFNGQSFDVLPGKIPNVHYKVDLLEMFKTPTTVDFTTFNQVMGGVECLILADNYVDMITLDHIHQ